MIFKISVSEVTANRHFGHILCIKKREVRLCSLRASYVCRKLSSAAEAFHHVAHRTGAHDALHHLAGAFELLEELVYFRK